MDAVRMKGRNVEVAVEAALQVLGARREDVDVKVLKEGKGGVLGVFGGEDAEVEVSIKANIEERGTRVLQDILDKAGFDTMVSSNGEKDERLQLEIKGEDMGRIIGKEGATLDALQILVSSILSRGEQKRRNVTIDAEGYRKRREDKMRDLAKDAIEEAVKKGGEVILPPMDASDRRAVHIAVKEDSRVTSFSRGEGPGRRVVISTDKDAEGDRPRRE